MITNNTNLLKDKDIFIATHTSLEDRHKYIKNISSKKCSLLVVDKSIKTNIPYITVNNTNETYFNILNNFYNKPFDKIKLIGITGTDGKTSSAYITKQLLNNFYNTAYLGTNGLEYNNVNISTKNTTPGIKEILEIGNTLVNNNIKYLVLEASSEGLLNNRLEGLNFLISGLTNISLDHLNIHKTLENYLDSKLKLFKNTKYSILNKNDKYYKLFKKNSKKVITYGEKIFSNYRIKSIKEYDNYTTFNLIHKRKKYFIKSPYISKFNIYNLVLAITIVNKLGINISEIIKYIPNLLPIKGRLNILNYNQDYKLILDYAHTSKATYEILTFFNKFKKNRIITVLGCAGSRYKEKRKEIGLITTTLSDIVIFTTDDPRYENINNIYNDILKETNKRNFLLIKNRKKAIYKALNIAKKNDIVLILGKGCDNYIAIKNKYIKYNDLDTISNYFNFH